MIRLSAAEVSGARRAPPFCSAAGGIEALDLHALAAGAGDDEADDFVAFLHDLDRGVRARARLDLGRHVGVGVRGQQARALVDAQHGRDRRDDKLGLLGVVEQVARQADALLVVLLCCVLWGGGVCF